MKRTLLLCTFAILTACTAEPRLLHITAVEYGDQWPLTVSEADLECREIESVVIHANGTTYTLNGTAKSRLKELPNVREIWKDNPSFKGMKIPIGDLVSRGLSLCKK